MCSCLWWLSLAIVLAASVMCDERCDQTPVGAKELTPTLVDKVPFKLKFETKGSKSGKYLPDQTYIVKITAREEDRPFTKFMITAEAEDIEGFGELRPKKVEVGSLQPLQDHLATYSTTCKNTVMNIDNSNKKSVTVHWISPKADTTSSLQRVRFRAMVAENDEVWYAGSTTEEDDLSIVLEKDNANPVDKPPLDPLEQCNLCSEARYEVEFRGQWSKGNHPLNFPMKPDDIEFESMMGASHSPDFVLWVQGVNAHDSIKAMIQKNDKGPMLEYIINSMNLENGTRTLIKGKRRRYPYTSEPQHSLFRVSRVHHMFSVFIQMKPSPDWFLGTTRFELCSKDGWLEEHELQLYPWDAGLMEGVSYTSKLGVTNPVDHIKRVGMGSFNEESPFYQMNLDDVKPFAFLRVRRLDVYPLPDELCPANEDGVSGGDERQVRRIWKMGDFDKASEEEPLAESLSPPKRRCFTDWSDWSPCLASSGACGLGTRMRARHEYDEYDEVRPLGKCYDNPDIDDTVLETRKCLIPC